MKTARDLKLGDVIYIIKAYSNDLTPYITEETIDELTFKKATFPYVQVNRRYNLHTKGSVEVKDGVGGEFSMVYDQPTLISGKAKIVLDKREVPPTLVKIHKELITEEKEKIEKLLDKITEIENRFKEVIREYTDSNN